MQREFHLYSQENGKNPTYFGVLGDTGRTLKCYMNDVNVLEEVSEATIWVKKPDGTNVYDDCEVNEDGTITIPITSQMLAIVGEAGAQVQLYGDDGYITSYEFKIVVLDTIVDEDAPQSTNEWGALETLLAKANAVIVSTKAEMTDHDKIYFLSTDGHYYYWSSVDNDFVKTELSHADIVDNLLSDDATKVLSAKQGKILKELIDTHEVDIATVDTPGIVKPDGTTITITEDGTISGAQTYELPTASAIVKGGIKVGDHLHMNGEVLSADGGIYVGDTEPTDVDVWIDTDEEGADFCYVGDTEPPNDGSVAIWVDTSEDFIPPTYDLTGVESRTLLWTNPNPSSAFNPQTLSLNLSDYDFIEIECSFSDPQASQSNIIKVSVGKSCWLHVDGFDLSKDTVAGVENDAFRYVSTTQSGITFNNGNQRYNSNLYKDWNIRCVPQKIYGIKKVVS